LKAKIAVTVTGRLKYCTRDLDWQQMSSLGKWTIKQLYLQ